MTRRTVRAHTTGSNRARLSALATALSCMLLAGFVLTGCGNPLATADDGFSVTVPVLWAGQDAEGQPTGGIEAAGVWTGADSTPGYSVDLADIEAQGAGSAWQAASGSAASVGAFFSSVDPTTLGIRFTITGPIDGPSGGAALTVGVVAATRHQQLRPDVTMTGTITPDGTVGRVSGIPAKLRAAAENGYKTVLLPQANMVDRSNSDVPASMEEFGKTLGLTVTGIDDLSDAYQHMTGAALNASTTQPVAMSAPVVAAVNAETAELLKRFSAALKRSSIPAKQLADLTSTLSAAKSAHTAGDTATSYARAMAGYRELLRTDATVRTTEALKRSGAAKVQSALLAEAKSLERAASDLRQQYAGTTSFGLYQELALPTALAPLTYAIAVLTDVQKSIQTDSSSANLVSSAAIAADQRASINSAAPTSRAVVAASASVPSEADAPAIDLLSGYTNFLVKAGNANQEYFNEVLGGSRSKGSITGTLQQLVRTLGEQSAAIPTDEQDLASEFVQSSEALSYFIFSTALVTDQQAFEIRDEQLGAPSGRLPDPEPVRNSISTGKQTVDATVSSLAKRDVNAELANWLATWGTQAATVTSGTPDEIRGSVVALHQIWGACVNALILQAGADRRSA